MKKTLYSTTFLATAGLLAMTGGDAFGQAAAPAAEKLKLSLGGYMYQKVGYADQDTRLNATTALTGAATAGTTPTNRKHFDQKSDAEVYFLGSLALDNGLTVAVRAELEADIQSGDVLASNTLSQGSVMDESYMTIGSATLGTLYLGATNAAAFNLGVAAPWAGNNFFDGSLGEWILSPGTINATTSAANRNRASLWATTYNGSFDYNRVEYISPSIAGFRIGGGYAPSTASSGNQPTVTETNHWNAAIQYADKWGDFAPRLYAGWWRVEGAAATVSDTISLGADVTWAGFTLGGGWAQARGAKDNVTTTGDGLGYNAGLKWTSGPLTVAGTWAHGKAEDTQALAADDHHTRYSLGADYVMGPGVTWRNTAMYLSYTDETHAAQNENDGWAIVTGVQVDF